MRNEFEKQTGWALTHPVTGELHAVGFNKPVDIFRAKFTWFKQLFPEKTPRQIMEMCQ